MATADPAATIRLLCLDVDGVLTDGGLWVDPGGRELKRFDVRDGLGVRLWLASGREIAVVTGRPGSAVRHRLSELGVGRVIAASGDKVAAIEPIRAALRLGWESVAMVGDDLPDLPLLRRCGLPIAVADAVEEVQQVAHWRTNRPGGHGAVREAIERILREDGAWASACASIGAAVAG
jgi:3-deoxy-D-manno-octulosonate 8-phosphate phosphatase (KDO 8-P phosphatase)